jgi:molybdenum cofactor cytidylyltransferase
MKAQTVDVRESTGRILCCTIFRSTGKKLLAKGHIISDDDIRILESEGMQNIWVTELEEGEVGEDEAVCAVASEVGCGCYEIKLAAGGRANLIATEPCCVLVDDDLLKQVNCTASVNIATALNFSFAMPGQRIATVKSAPFAVSQSDLAGLVNMLKDRGPIMQARPIRTPSIAILYTDPVHGDRARQMFEPIMRQRLERFGLMTPQVMSCVEEESAVVKGIQSLLRSKPALVLIASTTAPAGPEDVIGRALAASGGQIERFLAPVEPGNLMMLSYRDDIPIVSAPGCFRSAKPNVVDLILPPLMARYRVSTWEIACLGHGGLLG